MFKLEFRQSYFCVKWHRLLMIISQLYQFAVSVDWAAPGWCFVVNFLLCTVYFIELEWSINGPIKIRPDLLNNILQHSSNK